MAEFIYQMYKARKAVGDKVILDDVTLSFYPGAKIGVVGPNGMGKCTRLTVMAGLEELSNGEARLTPGYTVGILLQEPPLGGQDRPRTFRWPSPMCWPRWSASTRSARRWPLPMPTSTRLMDEMGKLQDEIDAANGWTSTPSSPRPWTRCSAPTRTRP